MRVLHISPSFAPAFRYGGPVHSLVGLCKGLIQCGDEVRVLTTDCDGPMRLDVAKGWTSFESVPVRYAHTWADRDFAPSLLLTPRAELAWADVVHVTGLFCSTSMWGIAAAKREDKPVVLSPHGVLDAGSFARESSRKRLWLRAFRPVLRNVSAFHSTSESEAVGVRRSLGDVQIVQVANGVDLECLRPATTTPPRVIALGRIHPIKGYIELVRAVSILQRRGVTVELCVAGPTEDPAYGESVVAEAKALGIRLELRGALAGAEKTRFLSEGRVLALPSQSENFGMVVLEALGSAVPVVAVHTTPWRSLESERCGRWVSRDPEALADALQPYLVDAALASQSGARGRMWVEKTFQWNAIARQMHDAYCNILEGRA